MAFSHRKSEFPKYFQWSRPLIDKISVLYKRGIRYLQTVEVPTYLYDWWLNLFFHDLTFHPIMHEIRPKGSCGMKWVQFIENAATPQAEVLNVLPSLQCSCDGVVFLLVPKLVMQETITVRKVFVVDCAFAARMSRTENPVEHAKFIQLKVISTVNSNASFARLLQGA